MPKTVQYLIVKILIVAVFVSALVIFGLDWSEPAQSEAALTQVYGNLTCDEFIPIGNALDEVLDILDDAFEEYQGESMTLVMDNIIGLLAALTKYPNVCDFTKCVAQVDNQGPELGVIFDAFFWQGELAFKVPPWCAPQEGIGEPCPDISQYLEGNDENIMGLTTLRDSFMASAEKLHNIFEIATEPLPADLARYKTDEDGNLINKDGKLIEDEGGDPVFVIKPGTKITKADLALRLAEQVEIQLTPGAYQSCALSALERKLVADGRIGDVFPMQCKQAREEGLYWPRQWSLECAKECESGSEKDCIKCLDDPPGPKASQLAEVNYKIYGKCKKECDIEDPTGPEDGDAPASPPDGLGMNEKCLKCLCTKEVRVAPVAGSGGTTGGATQEIELSEEECFAWFCGGSTSNWVCCHETPLEGLPDMPEIEPFTN